MKRIVISQPMLLPWIGLFEQIRLADVFLHYDDVQLPRGRSFMNRVQIKTSSGVQWLTVPIQRKGRGNQLIHEVRIDNSQPWREKHLKTLRMNYAKASYVDEMISIVEEVYLHDTNYLSELNIYAIERISAYFGLSPRFDRSLNYKVQASSSEKLLRLMILLKGDIYITGHGARNYLDHDLFEKNGIRVEYMDYKCTPYPQLYGDFDPHVSILDLIANVGREGIRWIHSSTKYWRNFFGE